MSPLWRWPLLDYQTEISAMRSRSLPKNDKAIMGTYLPQLKASLLKTLLVALRSGATTVIAVAVVLFGLNITCRESLGEHSASSFLNTECLTLGELLL